MKTLRQQRGITLSGLIMACIVLGAGSLLIMKLWPIYNEKLKVDQAMDKLQANPEGFRMTKTDMIRDILRQFEVSDVDTFDPKRMNKVLQVGRKKDSPNKIAVMAYEIRAPLFSNLDIIMNYRKTAEFPPPKTD